jgi:hypothetical protein
MSNKEKSPSSSNDSQPPPVFIVSYTPACDNCGGTEQMEVDDICCGACKKIFNIGQ